MLPPMGNPRQARLVGYAMHRVPDRSNIPWHRVVDARGRIAKRAPSWCDGIEEHLQRTLLEREGIRFDAIGRIGLETYRWKPRWRSRKTE